MALRESDRDTIAAIATASGDGGVGIVRLSGKEAITIAGKIFISKNSQNAEDQKGFTARYGRVVSEGKILDEAILLVMRAPKSYTAEDVAEIQVHGGSVVLQEVLALAIRQGARLAQPGEFTQRAFLNGRIDLLQAEAVLGLIQAKTEKSRQWATAQLEGSLSKKTAWMRAELLEILSFLEASIDFPEDDLETGDYSGIEKKLNSLRTQIQALLSGSSLGLLARRGVRVALWGRPNAGKSSLMNSLTRHNRVIVTPTPGTTRDVVEDEVQLEGFPVKFLDMAGIQESGNLIEKESVSRSRQAMTGSDLVLYVLDANGSWGPQDTALFHEIGPKPKIIVLNKSDLPVKVGPGELKKLGGDARVVETSCQTGKGVEALEKQIVQWITGGGLRSADEDVISSVRQKDVLEKMLLTVQTAQNACQARLSPELVAVDVRLAMDHLGALVGEIVTDDLLDILFSQFCIGK